MDPKETKTTVDDKLRSQFAEYLATLSNVQGERRNWSFQLYAQTELENFLAWRKTRRETRQKEHKA